ncbi:MAG: hypothetical protein FWG66_13800 [Spirochaetes bacterium]|nr:hypothetical protein [Spirochaetota bacterium]
MDTPENNGGNDMELKELLKGLSQVQIDNLIVDKIENLYKTELPDDLKKIISLSKETTFYDDRDLLRGLSSDEILNASDNLELDFVALKLLPLFDIGDNNFIVYNFEKNCWSLFNIVDETLFNESSDLLKYIE